MQVGRPWSAVAAHHGLHALLKVRIIICCCRNWRPWSSWGILLALFPGGNCVPDCRICTAGPFYRRELCPHCRIGAPFSRRELCFPPCRIGACPALAARKYWRVKQTFNPNILVLLQRGRASATGAAFIWIPSIFIGNFNCFILSSALVCSSHRDIVLLRNECGKMKCA